MQFEPANARTAPFAHQRQGTQALLDHPRFALFDEMGAGKSKQVIDAACYMATLGLVDWVVIVAPASCRTVWLDDEIGEIKKHGWTNINHRVVEFHVKRRGSHWHEKWHDVHNTAIHPLTWVVTNYEFLRSKENLKQLEVNFDHATMLVLDESSFVKNRTAQQAKAAAVLAGQAARVVLLNGTPVTNSPLDLWSQMNIMDRKIFARFRNYYSFRASFAIMGGYKEKQVIGFQNLDKLQAIVAPHVMRREKKDCLDLPEKLYSTREVKLTEATWKIYRELRRDAILALEGHAQLEPNAAVRIVRLAQLTSGIVGINQDTTDKGMLAQEDLFFDDAVVGLPRPGVRDVSSEKLDWLVEELTEWSTARAVIVWCRFRRERERLFAALGKTNKLEVFELYGGQKRAERELNIGVFSKEAHSDWPKVLVAQTHAGGYGLNLVAATHHYYASNDFSLAARLQSEDRSHRPGQRHPVTYTDVLATGPAGQKTVDHAIVKALRKYDELARWTAAAWRRALEEE